MEIEDQEVVTVDLRYVSVYYVSGSEGGILVDAGDTGRETAILQRLAEHGIQPQQIRCIVITHAHADHYGSLAALKEMTGAKSLASRVSAEFMREGRSEPVVPRSPLLKSLFSITKAVGKVTGGADRETRQAVAPVETDIIVDDDRDLREFGVNGGVVLTPGHTSGSLSVYLDSGKIIVGDTFVRLGGFTLMPLFQDREGIAGSLRKILALRPKVIYPSHGKSCGIETVQRLYDRRFSGTTMDAP